MASSLPAFRRCLGARLRVSPLASRRHDQSPVRTISCRAPIRAPSPLPLRAIWLESPLASRCVSMVCSHRVLSSIIMPSSFAVVPCSIGQVVCCPLMVFGGFLRHRNSPFLSVPLTPAAASFFASSDHPSRATTCPEGPNSHPALRPRQLRPVEPQFFTCTANDARIKNLVWTAQPQLRLSSLTMNRHVRMT